MFESIRKHSKIVMIPMFTLIILSFAFVGVEGYVRNTERSDTVAKVDGQAITQAEWDAYHRNVTDQMRMSMPNMDPKFFDTPQERERSLERMVRERLLFAAAQDLRLGVSDQKLAQIVQQQFASVAGRDENGQFDMKAYTETLARMGQSPAAFEANIRASLGSQQVLAGVFGSTITDPSTAKVSLDAFLEEREVRTLTFKSADFTSKVNPTEADLNAYYQQNKARFERPEQAKVEYVVLSSDEVAKDITPTSEDLNNQYEEYKKRELQTKEERRASHILIKADKDMSSSARTEAKAKAQALLDEVKKNPSSFAEVAKKSSEDPGSASSGGDLNFFTRNAMVKPFSDAVFDMKKGDVSDLVESEFGYHIIQLTDLKPVDIKPLSAMRSELEAEFKKEKARLKFAEVSENFSNTVYEKADDLQSVAQQFHLPVRTAPALQRHPVPGAPEVLNNPKVLEAVFAPDSIASKRMTTAIEVKPGTLVAARIVEHKPITLPPFEEVQAQARALFVAERALALARQEGAAKVAQWSANPADANGLGKEVKVSRTQSNNQPQAVVEAALRASKQTLPSFVGTEVPEGYTVVKVESASAPAKTTPDAAAEDASLYNRQWGNAESVAYYAFLSNKYKVQTKTSSNKTTATP